MASYTLAMSIRLGMRLPNYNICHLYAQQVPVRRIFSDLDTPKKLFRNIFLTYCFIFLSSFERQINSLEKSTGTRIFGQNDIFVPSIRNRNRVESIRLVSSQ